MENSYQTYVECLKKAVESFEYELDTVLKYIAHFKTGKRPLPVPNEKLKFRARKVILYVDKDMSDPFGITYNIAFATRMSRLIAAMQACMYTSSFEFELHTEAEKQLFLNDFEVAVKEKYNTRPVIQLNNKMVTLGFKFVGDNMPVIIALKDVADDTFGTFYFLLKEETLSLKCLTVLRQRIENAKQFDNATKEDIIRIVEDTIEEYGGTIMPYSLYTIRY